MSQFSPWGTAKIYRDGELRVTRRYVFLDDRTIEVESHNVPGRITEEPQYTRYQLQLAGDSLTMTWTLIDEVSVYQRAGQEPLPARRRKVSGGPGGDREAPAAGLPHNRPL